MHQEITVMDFVVGWIEKGSREEFLNVVLVWEACM
jgi:hypothetical protein